MRMHRGQPRRANCARGYRRTCNGVTPLGQPDASGNVPAIGGFCFQDVGIARAERLNLDPSLNVDVNRNGIEPDAAFTGTNDSVPWVVWYETGAGGSLRTTWCSRPRPRATPVPACLVPFTGT
jgi:hypothetical protein